MCGLCDKVMIAVRQEHHMYFLIETALTSLIKWKFAKDHCIFVPM